MSTHYVPFHVTMRKKIPKMSMNISFPKLTKNYLGNQKLSLAD